MEKIELQEILDACEKAESDYIKLFRPLLGYEGDIDLNRGIYDDLEAVLNEIETGVGIEFPGDFLQLYLISNGGKYFDINLYYLTDDKEDKNGLYYNNFNKEIKENHKIPEECLIIGENKDNQLILTGIDENGYYYYCTWDKEKNMMDQQFDYLVEILMYEIDYYTEAFSSESE